VLVASSIDINFTAWIYFLKADSSLVGNASSHFMKLEDSLYFLQQSVGKPISHYTLTHLI
jgi:hypothetical protein